MTRLFSGVALAALMAIAAPAWAQSPPNQNPSANPPSTTAPSAQQQSATDKDKAAPTRENQARRDNQARKEEQSQKAEDRKADNQARKEERRHVGAGQHMQRHAYPTTTRYMRYSHRGPAMRERMVMRHGRPMMYGGGYAMSHRYPGTYGRYAWMGHRHPMYQRYAMWQRGSWHPRRYAGWYPAYHSYIYGWGSPFSPTDFVANQLNRQELARITGGASYGSTMGYGPRPAVGAGY